MRNWSLLYIVVAVLSVIVCIYAPFDPNWRLPPNVSTTGREVDHLFELIMGITGLTFVGVSIAFGIAAWKFVDAPGRKAKYMHGSQRLEIVWTVIPAGILVFIALYQMGTWTKIKFRSEAPRVQPIAEVSARQFQWLMVYPGPDGRLHTPDDLHTVNDLHFVKGKPALIYLKSQDVIHSFFLPQMRIKQDALPGMTIPVWFDSDTASTSEHPFELVCAELCGWGHYKMRSKVVVHETQAEFDEWVTNSLKEQNRDQLKSAKTTTAAVENKGGQSL